MISDRWIVSKRGKKNPVDPKRPYGWLVEKERTVSGRIEDVGIIFLTNRECPYHCLMCDLWKNTTDFSVAAGSIPDQIEFALKQFPAIRHVKLYNSGSFFDPRAVPEEDYESIAALVSDLETVIVECHPRLINERCVSFRELLKPELHIAIGLETVHRDVLRKLNKRMTKEDFANSVRFLKDHNIPSRAFILLKPPFMNEEEGIIWAEQTIDFAFNAGVECCTVIPVRGGNGAMEVLSETGEFSVPKIKSLEEVLEYGILLNRGRVFADTWDLGLFSTCDKCIQERTARITKMNLEQIIAKRISCSCDHH